MSHKFSINEGLSQFIGVMWNDR